MANSFNSKTKVQDNMAYSYKRITLLFIILLCIVFNINSIEAQSVETKIPGDPLKIEGGLIAGKLLPNGVKTYLAIPYAAPPVGELRWRETQPVIPWTGIRDADNYCAPCAQQSNNSSEDCLYLNIWAPVSAVSGKMPVIVYIHGGAFQGGWGSPSGEVLARKGVVFVNFNYRLGLFGNLAHPDLSAESKHNTSGNYAHLDQLAVLKWIHNNISKFGGDPGNVTLMGQSSGSIDVCYLQSSPLAYGFIHKVVGLSGATFPGGPWVSRSQKEGEQAGIEFQKKTGCKSLAELRALPVNELLKGANKSVGEPVASDGYVLPFPSTEIFATNKQNHVPAILCICRDELGSNFRNIKSADEFKDKIKSLDSDNAENILKLFPVSSEEDVRNAVNVISVATGVSKQMILWGEAQLAGKSPAYLAVFSHGERAGHGSDIEYWIGNITLSGKSAADIDLSDKMSDALVAFARTGNPNTSSLNWPEYNRQKPSRLILDNDPVCVSINKDVYQLLDHPEIKLDGYQSVPRNTSK
jgi:para-nitrobenzyl esterase